MRSLTIVFLAVAICLVSTFASAEGYYELLGIAETATEKEVKQGYREATKKYHPDLYKGPDARDKGRMLNEAYDVLSDKKKRKMYDILGKEGVAMLEKASNQGQRQMHDPFMAMFGGGQMANQNKGSDMRTVVEAALEDFYTGRVHTISVDKQLVCRACKGTGAASQSDFKKCTKCRGRGAVTQQIQIAPGFVQQVQSACPVCSGSGKEVKNKCPKCKGKRVTRGKTTFTLNIGPGCPEEHEIHFPLEADEHPDKIPGDLTVVLKSKTDSTDFRRRDNDLYLTVQLTLKEALVGFKKQVMHMDSHVFTLSHEGVTQFGTVRTLVGEGMPIHDVPNKKGNLHVTYEFSNPKLVTEEMKSVIRELF